MATTKRKRMNWSLDEEEAFSELLEAKQVDRLIEAKKFGQGSIFSMISEEMRKRGYDRNVLQVTEKYKKMKKTTRKDIPSARGSRCSSLTFKSPRVLNNNAGTSSNFKQENGLIANAITAQDSESVAACQAIETSMAHSDFNYEGYDLIPDSHIIETIGTIPDGNVVIEGVVDQFNVMNEAGKMADSFLENLHETTNEIISQITEEVPHQTDGMFDDGDGNILLLLPEKTEPEASIVQNVIHEAIGEFAPFNEDDIIEEDTGDQPESDNKDDVELDPSLNKAKTNYSRALTGFLDRWISTCDELWESQKAFWDEQRDSLKKWEENVLETQRRNNMELVMMCNNTLKTAILKLCSDRKFLAPTGSPSEDLTYVTET